MSVPQPTTPAASPDLALRVLYMVLFGIVFWLLTWTLAVVTLLQLVLRLVNGRPQAEVARFGAGLGRYAREIIEFLTFVTDVLPYPFRPWPAQD
jgi:hypothetical protein